MSESLGLVNMLRCIAKGGKVADGGIQVANQLTLKQGDDSGLSGWVLCNLKGPSRVKERQKGWSEPERWWREKDLA